MILGIGIDIVEVARISKAMKSSKFIERVLTESERRIELSPQRVAGRWAAKEAVAKALSCDLHWHDVEISNDDLGAPVVRILKQNVLKTHSRVWISISHERGHAAAVAVWESERPIS